jgi:hypothetical protein
MAERRTFVKHIDGQQAVAYATTPAAAVQLRFNGWREQTQTSEPATPETPDATDTTDATQPEPAANTQPKTQPSGEPTTQLAGQEVAKS